MLLIRDRSCANRFMDDALPVLGDDPLTRRGLKGWFDPVFSCRLGGIAGTGNDPVTGEVDIKTMNCRRRCIVR